MTDPLDPKANMDVVQTYVRQADKREPGHERLHEAWQVENRSAIEAWNRWIEINGIPFDDLRPW
jgi:post-segregation antitoxin (ccd killing protein)